MTKIRENCLKHNATAASCKEQFVVVSNFTEVF